MSLSEGQEAESPTAVSMSGTSVGVTFIHVCAQPSHIDTAHLHISLTLLTHSALTHAVRCRIIQDVHQLAQGVHYLTVVCTNPLFC